MSYSFPKSFVAGSVFAAMISVFSFPAFSQGTVSSKVEAALTSKNLAEVQSLLASKPGNVDDVIKALLKKTQGLIKTDPDYSSKMMSLAGQFAPQITPPSVPVICSDLRRIADALTPEQAGSPLYKTVIETTQAFSKAPVVVASGRPNECEQAWLRASNESEEALLAMTPALRGPGLPPVTVGPGIPPTNPSPSTDKPSAD